MPYLCDHKPINKVIMKKILLTLVAVLCCTICVSAQETQEARNKTFNITLGDIEYAHHNDELSAGDAIGKILTGAVTGKTSVEATKYEEDVKSAIIKGLSGAHRFRYNDGLLRLNDILEEGNLVVNALITNITSESSSRTWKDKDDKTHVETSYTANAQVTLTLRDAKTKEILANPKVNGRGMSSSNIGTSEKAIQEAIAQLSGQVTNWLNKYRPLKANIIEAGAVKKDKQKQVYIDLGSSEGAYEGLHMGVYQLKTIRGKEARSEVGKLKIEAVEGDEISRCKVQSGAKEIKTLLEAGENLVVISID